MNVRRVLRALGALWAVMVLAQAAAFAAPDDLLKMVPGDWPAVARVDISGANASGAYLQSFKDDPEYIEAKDAAVRGFGKLIAALGIEIDPEKGILPWWGEQMAIGVDPASKPIPRVVVAIASKDRALAKSSLFDAVGSVARADDPVVHQVNGAEVYIWKLPKENMTPCYAVGDGFVLFAESVDTIKAALAAGSAGTLPAAAALLKEHAGDIVAFAVNTEKLMEAFASKPEDGEMGMGSWAAMAGSVNPHGGVRFNDKGAVLSVFGAVPPMLGMMAAPLLGSLEPAPSMAELLPRNSLASLTAASAMMTAPLQEKLAEVKSRPDLAAAALLLSCSKDAPAGMALTALLPRPSYALVVRTPDEVAAAAVLADFHKKLAKQGMRKGAIKAVSPGRPAMAELIPAKGSAETLGYIGQSGSAVVFGSDWRSAQKTALVTPQTSLAANPGYTGAMGLMPGGHAADAWLGLSVVSAVGDLYEAVGARYTSPMMKWITDSLKGTDGLGASVGLTGEQATVQLALGTKIGPATPVIGLAGLVTAASMAMIGRETYQTTSDARDAARRAVSESKLKMLVLALRMYSDDYQKLPPAGTWPKALAPYLEGEDDLITPWAEDGIVYKFNAKLGGLNEDDILNPSEVIAIFEWDASVPLDYNVIAGPDGTMRVAYLDMHTETLTEPPGAKAFTPKLKAAAKPKAVAKPKPPAKKPAVKK